MAPSLARAESGKGITIEPGLLQKSSQGRQASPELMLLEAVERADLAKVTFVTISPDGKFLYARLAGNPGTLIVFARDLETGKLTHVQTFDGQPELAGAACVELSPDARLAVVVAFQSRNAILYRRDAESGRLTQLDIAVRNPAQDMEFPVSAKFSPDGKFVAIADDGGRSEAGGVRVFRVYGEKLLEAGFDQGRNRCYSGARTVAFHPDGKTLFVTSCRPGALVVTDFDRETGATKVRQTIWAPGAGGNDISKPDVGGISGVRGVVHLVVSKKGRFIITCAGRFGGETGLTSFKFGDDGHLSFAHGVKSSGKNFLGGNTVALSPDERSGFATGTISGVVACARFDPTTGSLVPSGFVPDGGPPGGPGENVMGAAGITVSPDGRFVYVATEDKSAISIFERKPSP